ncbi:DUF4488 domain-containing protein [Dysgonomonadaceae bacterium zrk40]|nr:DUF4488 domain-containing protein [Dysgonomonadaceae bacterium zrk40]
MKATKLTFLLLLTMSLVISCGSSRRAAMDQASRLYGLWEVKAIHNSDEPGYKQIPPGMFKMIFPNGQFMNFISTQEGAIITVDGSYRIEGDLYTEEIVHSFNKSQEGKHNPLQMKLSQQHFMYLRWFQPIDEFGMERNRWIEEIWQRVRIEDLEVSNVDLQQELSSLPVNEEGIRKVIE